MENLTPTPPCDAGSHYVLAALEQQLSALDRLGSHIAAAHVDAAIQQMRRELSRR